MLKELSSLLPIKSDTIEQRSSLSVRTDFSRPSAYHRLMVFVDTPSSSAASDKVNKLDMNLVYYNQCLVTSNFL